VTPVDHLNDFFGRVAIVTGAARGLGRAAAMRLCERGASVAVNVRDAKRAEELAASLGERALAIPGDVAADGVPEKIVHLTIERFGRIDILVNNAGGPPFGTFETVGDVQWQAAFELNLLSAVRLVRLVLPHMRKRGSGRIINIVSTSVKQPIDGLILSNTTRMAVVGLAKSLSLELAPDNITVNNVCPGRFLTDRIRQGHALKEQMAQGKSESEALRSIAQDIPMGRIGKPEELAALVAFLASEQAGYITGTTIQVDGGLVRAMF